MNFQEKVFVKTRKIPKGKVTTYKKIARILGKLKAYRAIGNALHKNTSKLVPCHRVIKFDGNVGGFKWGSREKIRKLRTEGVKVKDGKIDLNKYLYEF